MEKKSSKKNLKKWECKEGCDVSQKICQHLEKLLPHPDYGNSSKVMRDAYRIHQEITTEDPVEYEAKCLKLEKTLKRVFTGNESFRVSLIMDRVASHMSLREIAVKYGYVSGDVVRYLLKQSEDYLRTAGIIQKLKE